MTFNTGMPEMPHQCGHCGMWHTGTCPKIRSIEYYENGSIKKIEYHEQAYETYCKIPKPMTYDQFLEFWKE